MVTNAQDTRPVLSGPQNARRTAPAKAASGSFFRALKTGLQKGQALLLRLRLGRRRLGAVGSLGARHRIERKQQPAEADVEPAR
jgi:hypothetical protein